MLVRAERSGIESGAELDVLFVVDPGWNKAGLLPIGGLLFED